RLADAKHLGRGPLLVGGEHHSEGRQDHVEGAVRERQRFRVGLAELDLEPLGGGAFAGALEQRWHVIGGDHVAPATGPCGGGAAREALPLPAATSSTFCPERTSSASHSSSPTICRVVPITA